MNAEQLADQLDKISAYGAAEMLRRQHEAIKQLRGAIQNLTDHSTALSLNQLNDWVMLRKALADTEEYK